MQKTVSCSIAAGISLKMLGVTILYNLILFAFYGLENGGKDTTFYNTNENCDKKNSQFCIFGFWRWLGKEGKGQ